MEAAIAASRRIVWLSFAASVLSYRERVRAGKRIEIGPGAVKEVLGGPLSEQDYQDIAALVLVLVLVQNGKVGGLRGLGCLYPIPSGGADDTPPV